MSSQEDTAVVLLSGGLDSSTLLYDAASQGWNVITLAVYYGQRHERELAAAHRIAIACVDQFPERRIQHRLLNFGILGVLLQGSALTSTEIEVPDGHYAEETMKQTVVPNRNAILISIAAGIAVAQGASRVLTAVHAGDHHIYPDCRPQFIDAISRSTQLATEGFGDIRVVAPFTNKTKADIVKLGHELGVPFELTRSCYRDEPIHCGRCATCVERAEAFSLAGVEDPTEYTDPVFWKEAVETHDARA